MHTYIPSHSLRSSTEEREIAGLKPAQDIEATRQLQGNTSILPVKREREVEKMQISRGQYTKEHQKPPEIATDVTQAGV